jgi:hypothetical protein
VPTANGRPLEAGKLYKVDVAVAMPVNQFWSLTVYDRATFAASPTPSRVERRDRQT